MGDRLGNNWRCKLGCAVDITDNGSKLLIGHPSSNSVEFLIFTYAQITWKCYDSTSSPTQSYGLISQNCILKPLLPPNKYLQRVDGP